jgi:hypothetical protein
MSIKHLGGITLLGFVLFQYGSVGNGWVPFVLYVLGVTGGYAYSCWRHPWRPCGRCGGRGKHRGALWTYADAPCRGCGGSGRRLRLGARTGSATR